MQHGGFLSEPPYEHARQLLRLNLRQNKTNNNKASSEIIWTHCASSALFATNANHTRNHLSFEAALWASSSSVIWRTFSYAVTYHTVYIHMYIQTDSDDISSYVCLLFYTHRVVRKPSISQISKLQYSRVEPLLDKRSTCTLFRSYIGRTYVRYVSMYVHGLPR